MVSDLSTFATGTSGVSSAPCTLYAKRKTEKIEKPWGRGCPTYCCHHQDLLECGYIYTCLHEVCPLYFLTCFPFRKHGVVRSLETRHSYGKTVPVCISVVQLAQCRSGPTERGRVRTARTLKSLVSQVPASFTTGPFYRFFGVRR